MHRIRLKPRMSETFMLAGALMVVGALVFGLLMLTDGFWTRPFYVLAVSALAAIAGAGGLFGMQQALRDRMPRLARVGAVMSILGALSALLLLALVVAWLIEPFYPRTFRMDIVAPLLVVSLLAMLAAMFLALVLVGAAALRANVGGRVVGPLLVVGGLLLLVPLSYVLFPVGSIRSAPEWLFFMAFAVWAAIFVAVGSVLRSYDGVHTRLGARQVR